MSLDREQYIRKLEGEVRRNRLGNAVLNGIIWGGVMPPLAYEGINQLIGRQTYSEGILLCLAGGIVGPTVAFIRERRRQKQEVTLSFD